MHAGLKGDRSLQTATFRPFALIYPKQQCQQHTGEQNNLVPFVCCQATSTLKLLMSVCVHVCERGLSSSPKLHFLFHNSEHLLDGFLKRTRPPKPCQISAHSVRRTRVLSDWLHFELFFPPPCCQPLCSISNLAFKKRLRNGTKFNQPSSVLHNKARAEFRTHFIYLSWTDPDRCACTTGHFILRLLLLHRIEWMGWFSFSSN